MNYCRRHGTPGGSPSPSITRSRVFAQTAKTDGAAPFRKSQGGFGVVRNTGRKRKRAAVTGEADQDNQETVEARDVYAILERHDGERGGLIATLGAIQDKYGYLPQKALRVLGERTGRSLVDIYGVATFYRSFTLRPRGKHLVMACQGTACHVRGAGRIAEELERELGVKAGETTPDKQFTLETVNCLGACALGPVIVIDGRYFSKVRKSQIKPLLNDARQGFDKTEPGEDRRVFPIEVNCVHCGHALTDQDAAIDGAPSIRVTVSFDHKQGWLRFSSLYGSYGVSAEHPIPSGTVVALFCPHCRAELTGPWECMTCGAPMASLAVAGGGVLRVCRREGCKGRMLDIS
jgi:NADH:ubiquinone oxidoreductase subunit E